MKDIVLCDMDGIIADLLTTWLKAYERAEGVHVGLDQITQFDMHKCVPCGERIYDYLHKPGLFTELRPLPGAIDGLKQLNEFTDLVILTTPSRYSGSGGEKLQWLQEHAPFLKRDQVILAKRKELVYGHHFIDDSPEQLENWGAHWSDPEATITIDFPYNQHVKDVTRFIGYKDTAKAWAGIVQHIRACQ